MKRDRSWTGLLLPLLLSIILLLSGCSLLEPAYVKLQREKKAESEADVSEESEASSESETETEEPEDADLVLIKKYIPSIQIDLRYATKNNFTEQVIYESADAYLRYGTVKKLAKVQESLLQEGLSLKIWDAYRPTAAQFKLWEVCPDEVYVADPNKGFSYHSRGNTVDITIADLDGMELKMPTGFDDFTTKADRDYSDCEEEEVANANKLEQLMKDNGFDLYYGEWWHYSDQTLYEVYDIETGEIEDPTKIQDN